MLSQRCPTLVLLTLLAVAVAWPARAEPPRRLERVVPAEASMVLVVEDVPGLRHAWPDLPWVRAWNDPALQAFFAPARARGDGGGFEDLLEGTGARVSEVLDLVTGQVVVVLPDVAALVEAAGGRPTVAVLAHVGDNGAELTKLLRRPGDPPDHRDREKEGDGEKIIDLDDAAPLPLGAASYRGTTLHLRQEMTEEGAVDRQGWAVVDGVAVVAEPRSLLESLVGRLLDGGDGLLANADFTKVQARTGVTSGLLYLNVGSMLPAILDRLRQEQPGASPNSLGLTPETVSNGLGLDALDALYLSVQLGARETRTDMGVLAHADRGLFKAMAFQPPAAARPAYFPAEAVKAGVTYFSLPLLWTGIKEMLQEMNPMLLGVLEAQVAQMSAQLGVDLEKGLIGGLGSAISTVSFLPQTDSGQPGSLLDLQEITIIDITDPTGLQKALDALLGLFGPEESPFTVSRMGDVEIRTLRQGIPMGPAGKETKLAYAVTEGSLLVTQGGEEPIRRILAARASPGPSIWSRSDVRAALARLPPGASALGFADAALLLDALFETLVTLQSRQEEAPEADHEESFPLVDPRARPAPEVLRGYFGASVSGAYKDAGGLHFTWRLAHASP